MRNARDMVGFLLLVPFAAWLGVIFTAVVVLTVQAWPYFGVVGTLSILAWAAILVLPAWVWFQSGMRLHLVTILFAGFSLPLILALISIVLAMVFKTDSFRLLDLLFSATIYLLWAGTAAAAVFFIGWGRKTQPLAAVVAGLALITLVTSEITSAAIYRHRSSHQAETERSNKIAAAQRQIEQSDATMTDFKKNLAGKAFVEDDGLLGVDISTLKPEERKRFEEAAKAKQKAAQELQAVDAWKAGGKVERKVATPPAGPTTPGGEAKKPKLDTAKLGDQAGAAATKDPNASTGKSLSAREVYEAQNADVINRFAVRTALAIALLVSLAYLLRANNRLPFTLPPFPWAAAWIDAVFPHPDAHLVQGDPAALCQAVVARGGNLIYLGESEPLPGVESFHRWPRKPLPILRIRAGEAGFDPTFLFNAAWFGSAAVIVSDSGRSTALLASLDRLVAARRNTRSRASPTLDLIWDLDEAPPAEAFAWLLKHTADTGVRILRVTRDGSLPAGEPELGPAIPV